MKKINLMALVSVAVLIAPLVAAAGTINQVAKFITSTTTGDSAIIDDGSTIRTIGRDLNLEGTSAQKALRFKRTDVASSPHARIEFLDYNNVQYWNFGTNIAVGPGFEINEGTGAGTNRLNIAPGGNVGIGTGTAAPTSKLHIKESASKWLALENAAGTIWNFNYVNDALVGSALKIGPTGSPLQLSLANEAGGTRMYLWEEGRAVPTLPHTGVKPTFAVWGDLLIGDIVSIESNPIQAFMRQNTGLPASAVTNLYSAKLMSSDTDGGASVTLHPDDGSGTRSGAVEINAWGTGAGTDSNTVLLQTRLNATNYTPRLKVNSGGTITIPDLAGTGNDYVCVNSTGTLFRSNTAC